jgi:hypothetical protein
MRPGAPEEYDLLVQLKNLPERGRSDWGVDLPAALDQAQDEAGIDRRAVTQQSPLSLGSTMLIVQRELDAETFARILGHAVDLATEWFNDRKTSHAESIRRASELQEALRHALTDLTRDGGVYGAPTVHPEITPHGPGFRVRIPLINPTPQEVNLAHGGFSSSGRGLAGAWIEGADVTFPVAAMDEELTLQIQQVTRDTQATIQRYRRTDAEAEARRQDYWRQLAALLGEPPDPVDQTGLSATADGR